jgi:hypothetical protein
VVPARIFHDTFNLDNSVTAHVAFAEIRVNATEMNIHCSQVTDGTLGVFTLPQGLFDLSAGHFADVNGVITQNSATDVSVWITSKMPPPPYWSAVTPGLNSTAGRMDRSLQ